MVGERLGGEGWVGVDDLARALRDEVAELVRGASLDIIEFGSSDVIAWQVRQDRNGIPRAWYWPLEAASLTAGRDLGDDAKLSEIINGRGCLICVINSMDGSDARLLDEVEAKRPDMRTFRTNVPVSSLLRQAIRHAPLTHRYELVVLRRGSTGRPMLDGHELFAASTLCPKQTDIRIRCEPGEGNSTVLAVVATQGARNFQLVSAQAADIDPGVYDLTAELVRPGFVRFHGLPTSLRAEQRDWPDLVAQIPRNLAEVKPAHLICAIEISGDSEQIANRTDRVRQLLKQTDEVGGRLRVSLITYGSHTFDRRVPDEPATVIRWEASRQAVISVLDGLGTLDPVPQAYPKAAQLECVLALLTKRLAVDSRPRSERVVLVTAGVRPAFPPRVDPRTTILPCPHRNDWRRDQKLLKRTYPEIAFGAIYDDAVYPQDVEGEVWRELGANALVSGKYVNSRAFAADLKLRMSAEGLPFPLAETGGS